MSTDGDAALADACRMISICFTTSGWARPAAGSSSTRSSGRRGERAGDLEEALARRR
jgi:hypothetical protein